MDHCFLFTQRLDETACFCLKLSQEGEILAPPGRRIFSEIKTLQQDSSTILIESTANATLLDLELPWLTERKARTAIPYALEDKVAQPVEMLHFAFDKLRYQNQHYLIAVIGKQRMQYLMELFNQQNISLDKITLDWFALSWEELVVNESILLINNDDFKGALSGELALAYIKNHPLDKVQVFEDSNAELKSSLSEIALTKSEDLSSIWIAKKILHKKAMNLCQGEMLQGNIAKWIQTGYQLAGVLCGIWLLSLLLVNAISLYKVNKKIQETDQKVALIYHEFFPHATQVISPKFRISQLLHERSDSENRFWFLLNQFAKAMHGSQIRIEELRYQNKIFSTTLISSDFPSLEQIENQLKKFQVTVKQTQASSQDQQVVATLELM